MEVVQIISEWKKFRIDNRPRPGMKRVQAIVKVKGELFTRHIEIQK